MATSSANYNRVIIIQSLKEGRTGSRLCDDLSILTVFTKGVVSAQLVEAESAAQFMATLADINKHARRGDYLPILHFETHGAEDRTGIVLASGEFLSWQDLKGPLAEINEATQLNLIICVSACYGAGLTEIVHPSDRAPCWALVGPIEAMQADELLKDFTAFYDELLKTRDGIKALTRLNRGRTGNDVLYYFTTAERLFKLAWTHYIREKCSHDVLKTRANAIIRELKRQGSQNIPSRNDIIEKTHRLQPDYFLRTTERFFMMDHFPENRGRFKVEYDTIIREAKSNENNRPQLQRSA